MNDFWELMPWLIAMAILICCSAFFSASEAALFYLRPADRRAMRAGSAPERLAARLLRDPDRLLSAVLFWNLVINITYFAISSICAIRIEQKNAMSGSWAIGFALVSLLAIIFFSEMMPKTIAVLKPKILARNVAIPLAVAVRVVSPILPILRTINLISRRLIWPGFKQEQHMEIADLERAISLSGEDANLIKQEQTVLQNVVQLSDIRVDEWMRPLPQLQIHKPPVRIEDLDGNLPPSGYLLFTEVDSDEIEKALHVNELIDLSSAQAIDPSAEPVLYLPWCATVADALESMSKLDREVTAVVNEYGDTIGVLTVEDILESVFSYSPSRTQRVLDQDPMEQIAPGRWKISGLMSLKRLARNLEVDYPETHSVTVAGVIQEELQRVAEKGDFCTFGPFRFKVLSKPQKANLQVEVMLQEQGDDA